MEGTPITVEIVPEARFGTEPEMLRFVQTGDLDMAIITVANAAGMIPELALFSLPYLFSDAEHFRKVVAAVEFRSLVRAVTESRSPELVPLAVITPGVRDLYSVRPVERFDDISGMRVRVMASPVDAEVWAAWEAVPEAMPFGQIAEAIRSGRVEAAEDTPAVYFAQRHFELAGNLALTEHQWSLGLVFVNKRRLAELGPEAMRELVDYGRVISGPVIDFAVDSARAAIEAIERRPDIRLTRPDARVFRKRAVGLWHCTAARLGMTAALDIIDPML
jgi:TRAP-type C4-dicarboxylate transport system substrate-binding protein